MSIQLTPHWQRRFSGIARLYGNQALVQFASAHFVVIGLGGVGSWVAEALARSGIGALSLIDLDEICVTNTNRQLHALNATIGRSKAQVLAARLIEINPEMKVDPIEEFISLSNIPDLIHPGYDFVIDAIDMAHTKSGLIAYCLARKIGLVTVGSAGGKLDPSQVTWADLAKTESDPMLVKIRHDLYRTYRFARDKNRRFRVDAIYSTEPIHYPQPKGPPSPKKPAKNSATDLESFKLDCAGGLGASTMVTGSFGFLAAHRALLRFLSKQSSPKE